MKKRGFLCICLTVIMLVGLLPGVAIATANSDDFQTIWDTSNVGGFRFSVQRSGLISHDAERVMCPVLDAFRWESEITIRTGTSIRLYYGGFVYFIWGNPDFLMYFNVAPLVRYGEWYIMDFENRIEWDILPGNVASATFDTPGQFSLFAFKEGGAAINVVADEPPPTQEHVPLPIDIPSPWATEYVNTAIELGLVPPELQSAYTQATTRAEFAALVVTLYEVVTGREIAIDRSIAFSDTTDTNVHKAATIGVVMGVGGNRFDPNAELTREQAAVMLARLADAIGEPFPPSDPTFADNAQVSDWAADAVGQMQESGIMGGVGDNRFDPQGAYTREQSIVTILRLFNILG